MATLSAAEFYKTSATQLFAVGSRYTDTLGREFRYTKAGAANLGRGKLNIAAVQVSTHIDLSFTNAPAIGATVVNVTLGATNAVTANQYRGGMLVVQDGTGEGRAYGISNHPAAAALANLAVTLTEGLDTAGVVSEANVDLASNPWSGAIISATSQVGQPIGVNPVAINAAEFGFLATGGPVSVLMDEAIVVGLAVTTGTGVAGAVEALDGAGEVQVGIMGPRAGVDTEYQVVFMTLEGALR